jgi:nicotinamidase-related amidase
VDSEQFVRFQGEETMTAPRRALIVVDVQQEYFNGILQVQAPSREQTLANIVAALEVAEQQHLPVVVVQHQVPEGASVFAVGSESWSLHPEVEQRLKPSWKRVTKDKGSVFAGTDVAAWLAEQDVDTVTIVGYMTNNCDIATAVGAEELGLAAEILSDGSGAIHLANEAGKVSADQLHATLLVLLHSNFAAVASTEAWTAAVTAGAALPKSDLGTSAMQGRAAFAG